MHTAHNDFCTMASGLQVNVEQIECFGHIGHMSQLDMSVQGSRYSRELCSQLRCSCAVTPHQQQCPGNECRCVPWCRLRSTRRGNVTQFLRSCCRHRRRWCPTTWTPLGPVSPAACSDVFLASCIAAGDHQTGSHGARFGVCGGQSHIAGVTAEKAPAVEKYHNSWRTASAIKASKLLPRG